GLQRAGQGSSDVPGGGAAGRAMVMVSALRDRLMEMPSGKRVWLIASAAFLAAVCAGMLWFAQRPDWKTLFSGLDGKDTQQVSQELAAAGIPFETAADGAGIEVPADMLDKARMEVAAKGMPQSGRLGFELFDKPNWVGSEFDERVNYQRALEGELEHTIETLGVVRSARVHLVLPQPSLFASEEKAAKASVVLKLRRPVVDPEQADAIRSLVAGAVENLSPDQVTLVDADGRANLKPRSNDAGREEVEQTMEAKLVAMLEPLAGRDNVRATVNVSYEDGSEERTDEVYDPSQTATLTMQKSEQISALPVQPMGVPGTASNSPAGAPAGSVAGSQAAAAPGTPPLLQKQALPVYPQQDSGRDQSIHEENGTYGVTKHLLHSAEGPGRVRRITAAVVVNDRAVAEGAGKLEHTVWKPRSAEEMRRLEQLAQAAVGYDPRRGDQVVIENVSFSTNSPQKELPGMERALESVRSLMESQPGLMRTMAVGICGLLLILFVLRPMARQVTETLRRPQPLLTSGANLGTVLAKEQERMLPPEPDWRSEEEDAAAPLPVMTRAQRQQQGIFEHVSEHIRRDPAQSTRLLEGWIGSSEEGK
ncbi:MAG TPA: flagellar basal-body MS-ring/collar protein FliF, partial [Edaphobacter sp.]|nr:flagellar basal-body MS-ring/collar protein FliF [Edaphobacter sp.]